MSYRVLFVCMGSSDIFICNQWLECNPLSLPLSVSDIR